MKKLGYKIVERGGIFFAEQYVPVSRSTRGWWPMKKDTTPEHEWVPVSATGKPIYRLKGDHSSVMQFKTLQEAREQIKIWETLNSK